MYDSAKLPESKVNRILSENRGCWFKMRRRSILNQLFPRFFDMLWSTYFPACHFLDVDFLRIVDDLYSFIVHSTIWKNRKNVGGIGLQRYF